MTVRRHVVILRSTISGELPDHAPPRTRGLSRYPNGVTRLSNPIV